LLCRPQLPENKARSERMLLSYQQKLSKLQQQRHEQEEKVAELNAGLQGFAAQLQEMRSEERSLKRQLADAQRKVQDVQSRMEEAQVGGRRWALAVCWHCWAAKLVGLLGWELSYLDGGRHAVCWHGSCAVVTARLWT
jgi:hypothetical protein